MICAIFILYANPQPIQSVNYYTKQNCFGVLKLHTIQELNKLPAYRQKSKDFVRKKILEKVPEETLHHQISDELFERDYTTIQQEIAAYKKR